MLSSTYHVTAKFTHLESQNHRITGLEGTYKIIQSNHNQAADTNTDINQMLCTLHPLLNGMFSPLFSEMQFLWFLLSSFHIWKWHEWRKKEKNYDILFFFITDKGNAGSKILFQYLKDKFRASNCNFFYVNTTLWTANHYRSIAGSVHQDCKVCFPWNIQCFCNHHLKINTGEKKTEQWVGAIWSEHSFISLMYQGSERSKISSMLAFWCIPKSYFRN